MTAPINARVCQGNDRRPCHVVKYEITYPAHVFPYDEDHASISLIGQC